MDFATILNLLALAVGVLVLTILKSMWGSIKELRDKDDAMQKEINAQAVTVATN